MDRASVDFLDSHLDVGRESSQLAGTPSGGRRGAAVEGVRIVKSAPAASEGTMDGGKPIRVLVLVLLGTLTNATAVTPPHPVNPHDFTVMAWDNAPSDPEQLRLMKEAGLNIAGFCAPEVVERVRAAGLACFVSDGRVGGYDWEKLPPDSELKKNIAAAVHEVEGNPAVLGFILRDEPRVTMFPGLGHVASLVTEALPGAWPYINLFAVFGGRAYTGTDDYETYMREFVQKVHPPFLSYDDYSLVQGEMRDLFYTNLEFARRVSLEAKIPFWNCILSTAHYEYMVASDATLGLQVYSTLAYGGRGIEYYTYFTDPGGNHRLGPIDQFGYRTPTWDMLRRINYQIHALAPTLIHLHSTGVFHWRDVPVEGHPLAESKLVQTVEVSTPSLRHANESRFLLGEFEDSQGRPYLMLVNKDLQQSFTFRIRLKQEGKKLIWVSSFTGKETGEVPDAWLAPGAGMLFRVE